MSMEHNRSKNNQSTIVFGCDALEWTKKPAASGAKPEFDVPSAEQVCAAATAAALPSSSFIPRSPRSPRPPQNRLRETASQFSFGSSDAFEGDGQQHTIKGTTKEEAAALAQQLHIDSPHTIRNRQQSGGAPWDQEEAGHTHKQVAPSAKDSVVLGTSGALLPPSPPPIPSWPLLQVHSC